MDGVWLRSLVSNSTHSAALHSDDVENVGVEGVIGDVRWFAGSEPPEGARINQPKNVAGGLKRLWRSE